VISDMSLNKYLKTYLKLIHLKNYLIVYCDNLMILIKILFQYIKQIIILY
jgi:hypothetical protein